MATETLMDDDDAWLYGDNNTEDQRKEEINAIFDRATEEVSVPGEENIAITNGDVQLSVIENDIIAADDSASSKPKENEEDKDSEEDEDSDDDVQITIGDIKSSGTTYPYPGAPVNLNIKRGTTFTSGSGVTTVSKSKGIDLDSVGLINGINLYEFNLDTIEDKPWRKPGADITDYFNYGFNEDTWKAYCEKQKKLRLDNNVVPKTIQLIPGKDQHIPIATVNENSKYSGAVSGPKKAGPPPGRRSSGSIDVICGANSSRRSGNSKENVIQVIGSYDGTMPPGMPPTHIPPPFIPPNLSVPPPGLPPGISTALPPPPGALQGHVPYPDLYGNPIFSQPPPVAIPGTSSRGFDNNSESQQSWTSSPHRERDRERNRDKDRDRDHYWEERRRERRDVSEEEYKRRERDDYERRRYRDYRDRRDRERYDKDYDREYDRDYYERDRERERDRDREKEVDRDSREKERERRHRDHKEKDDRDKDRRSRRRHHHEDEEEERHSSSSRHKHKKSKREKEETSSAAGEGPEATTTENVEEENK